MGCIMLSDILAILIGKGWKREGWSSKTGLNIVGTVVYFDEGKALEAKERGNEFFKNQKFPEAIKEYKLKICTQV